MTSRLFLATVVAAALYAPVWADDPIPTPEALGQLLQREPISLASWPAWRPRLERWAWGHLNETSLAFVQAFQFIQSQKDDSGRWKPPAEKVLDRDAVAWLVVGVFSLYADGGDQQKSEYARAKEAESPLRRSIDLNRQLAAAYHHLATAIVRQELPKANPNLTAKPDVGRLRDARRYFEEASKLNPNGPRISAFQEADLALRVGDFEAAGRYLPRAVQEAPADLGLARRYAEFLISQHNGGPRSGPIGFLVDHFPNDGTLVSRYGQSFAQEGAWRAASEQFHRARELGTDPARVVGPQIVRATDNALRPSLLFWGGVLVSLFVLFYLGVMVTMAGIGLVLAGLTHGPRALELLDHPPDRLVAQGQVVRTDHESWLAALYGVALTLALLLFYAAIPFVIWGLLAVTFMLVLASFYFRGGQLHVDLTYAAGGSIWAVFRALFAGFGAGSFGVRKTAADCPRLYKILADVARRVDTEPVDQVYIAPGSSIGVHQEGRGPFGIFGIKKRVLTLGLSTLHFLTVSELEAILAHEYAHFSHQDTLRSRFIHQVTLSISKALDGMARTGGWVAVINPFYWFFYLYNKAYQLLASGYSRSREFLADRMACSLYGADVFVSGLRKVASDGALFEKTIYKNIRDLLRERKAYVNMYLAFRKFRDEELTAVKREELYQELLDDRPSLFDTHPTFAERVDAVRDLPRAVRTNGQSALQLLDKPEEVEKQMTDFLTGFMARRR